MSDVYAFGGFASIPVTALRFTDAQGVLYLWPAPDVSPQEAVLLAILIGHGAATIDTRRVDWRKFVEEHGLIRHFQAKP